MWVDKLLMFIHTKVTAQQLKAMKYLCVSTWTHLENMMLSEKSNLQMDTENDHIYVHYKILQSNTV